MNKAQLVEKVVKDTGLSQRAATAAVTSVFNNIAKAIKRTPVTIVGFGTFEVKKRKARTGHNFKTGKSLRIKAKKVPTFKPGKALKESIG